MREMVNCLLDLLFPPKCPFCGKVLDSVGICENCRADLPWTGEEASLCRLEGGLLCAAPLWYQDKVRKGLLRFKFHGGLSAAEPLGHLAARCAAERYGGGWDVVTWVPVSRKRLQKRGYDQAELLARAVGRTGTGQTVRLLEKTVDNPAQSGREDAAARRKNVQGVYRAVRKKALAGKRILLVDDICTTGSTLGECARVLKAAGAAEVLCACVARTVFERAEEPPDTGPVSSGAEGPAAGVRFAK